MCCSPWRLRIVWRLCSWQYPGLLGNQQPRGREEPGGHQPHRLLPGGHQLRRNQRLGDLLGLGPQEEPGYLQLLQRQGKNPQVKWDVILLEVKWEEVLGRKKCYHLNQEQDQNSTYRCALSGLRAYNLFNLFSLPIWVTFIFEWCSNLSENPICVTLQIRWHSNLSDILIGMTFQF